MNTEKTERWTSAYHLMTEGTHTNRYIAETAHVSRNSFDAIKIWGNENQKRTKVNHSTPPPAPPKQVRRQTDPIIVITEPRQNHDRTIWDTPRPILREVKFKSKDDFILWCKQQEPIHFTGNRLAVIKRIQEHARVGLMEGTIDLYIEFCNPKLIKSNFQNELKTKVKPGIKPSQLNGKVLE